MPRSDYPSQFCHATKDDLLKIDGLYVCDDCPKCKIRDVSCEVACHPITKSDESLIAQNFATCASKVTSIWGSCFSMTEVSKFPSNKPINIRKVVVSGKFCGQMQQRALANCLGGSVCQDEEIMKIRVTYTNMDYNENMYQSFDTMIRINRSDVPLYLKGGSFYDSLDAQDENAFEVPADCFKDDPSVETERELVLLLRTVRYWGLFVMPDEICVFILEHAQKEDCEQLLRDFPEFTSYLVNILKVKNASVPDRISATVEVGLGLSAVRLLHQKGYPWNESGCKSAARKNDLECLMYLHTEGCPWDERTVTAAIDSNSIPCLRYALDFGCPYGTDDDVMIKAAMQGRVECLRLLRAAGVTWNSSTVNAAISGNHLETVRYLHTQGCEVSATACCFTTVVSGNIEVLRYLHEVVGLSLWATDCFSAEYGYLACLQYAHEHGDTWDESTCMYAAKGGHLDCLRYAHEHGCPWDDETVKAAVSARSWRCLTYAVWHGCPWYSHLYIVVWLCTLAFVITHSALRHEYPKVDALIMAVGGTIVTVLGVYRKHVEKYLSVRSVDRTIQSSFLSLFMYKIYTGFNDFSWCFQIVSVPAFLLLAALLVRVNMIHVPLALNELAMQ